MKHPEGFLHISYETVHILSRAGDTEAKLAAKRAMMRPGVEFFVRSCRLYYSELFRNEHGHFYGGVYPVV